MIMVVVCCICGEVNEQQLYNLLRRQLKMYIRNRKIPSQNRQKTIKDIQRPQKTVKDYQRPSKTVKARQSPSKPVKDRQRPSKTVKDRHKTSNPGNPDTEDSIWETTCGRLLRPTVILEMQMLGDHICPPAILENHILGDYWETTGIPRHRFRNCRNAGKPHVLLSV